MCAAIAATAGKVSTTPGQQEILTRDYAFLKRVTGELDPKWITALTTLDERSVDNVIHIDSGADKPLLKLMADRFIKVRINEVFPEPALFSEGMAKSLALHIDRLRDDFTPSQKLKFLRERFETHNDLAQEYVKKETRWASDAQNFQARNRDAPMPKEMRVEGEVLRDKAALNITALEKLKAAMLVFETIEEDKGFVNDMANARLNFTVVENVEMSYQQLFSKLTQLELFLTHPEFKEMVRKELDDKVWEASTKLAEYDGRKYEGAILNFMYHKHTVCDDNELLFSDLESLVAPLLK